MEDTLFMNIIECSANLPEDRCGSFEIHALTGNLRTERRTVYVLHSNVGFTICQFASTQHAHHPRVIDACEGFYFLSEFLHHVRILQRCLQKNLYHDRSVVKP